MSEITRQTAEQLAEGIRAGRLSSLDVVEAYLARIAVVDPAVEAYVGVLADRARTQARRRDADAREGRWRGPLHGVPVAFAALANMHALSRRNDEPTRASRPFDKNRDGFVYGEGSGVAVIESAEHALARGATIHAEVLGAALTADAFCRRCGAEISTQMVR